VAVGHTLPTFTVLGSEFFAGISLEIRPVILYFFSALPCFLTFEPWICSADVSEKLLYVLLGLPSGVWPQFYFNDKVR